VRPNRTFHSTPEGKIGVLNNRPVRIILSSGDALESPTTCQPDFVTPYLRHIFRHAGRARCGNHQTRQNEPRPGRLPFLIIDGWAASRQAAIAGEPVSSLAQGKISVRHAGFWRDNARIRHGLAATGPAATTGADPAAGGLREPTHAVGQNREIGARCDARHQLLAAIKSLRSFMRLLSSEIPASVNALLNSSNNKMPAARRSDNNGGGARHD
jgi:hypothetical protein